MYRLGTKVSENDKVIVNNKLIKPKEIFIYYLTNQKTIYLQIKILITEK